MSRHIIGIAITFLLGTFFSTYRRSGAAKIAD
jgi:hypothetical protein